MTRKLAEHILTAALFFGIAGPLQAAFQSTQIASVTAGAFVGGPVRLLQINHTRLQSSSPVTKKVIILGEAGDEPPPTPPVYEGRLTTESELGPLANRLVRATLRFRFLTRDQFNGIEPAPAPTDLPVIEGSDPLAFAFQVTPSAFGGDVLQYRIIADRLELRGNALVPIARVTFPPSTALDTEPWVTVGVQSNASEVFGPGGGRLILPDGNPADGETAVDIPPNLFKVPTTVSIDEFPLNNPTIPPGLLRPVAVYRMDVSGTSAGPLQVSLLYPDFEYPRGQDGVVDGTNDPEQNTAIVVWDGFTWRRLRTAGSFRKNLITTKAGFFSYFAVVSGNVAPEDRRPIEKIITPNGDGQNDTAFFSLGDLTENVKVEIFDMNGHRIQTIMSATGLSWDGRNDSGETVESGVYIYQYKVGGKLVSGLIAVAK